ncbi:MAG: hypothetical protein AABY98_07035, partial [Candidatus Deferrimicrobiota bacterium]
IRGISGNEAYETAGELRVSLFFFCVSFDGISPYVPYPYRKLRFKRLLLIGKNISLEWKQISQKEHPEGANGTAEQGRS